jgi:hypothetical protein
MYLPSCEIAYDQLVSAFYFHCPSYRVAFWLNQTIYSIADFSYHSAAPAVSVSFVASSNSPNYRAYPNISPENSQHWVVQCTVCRKIRSFENRWSVSSDQIFYPASLTCRIISILLASHIYLRLDNGRLHDKSLLKERVSTNAAIIRSEHSLWWNRLQMHNICICVTGIP